MTSPTPTPWDQLANLCAVRDREAIEAILDELPGSEVARALAHLSEAQQRDILTLLTPHDAAEVLDEIPDVQAADLVEHLEAGEAATILRELPSDEQADLLGAVNDHSAEEILAAMDPKVAQDLRALADYPPDSAGGLMVTEVLRIAHTDTVGDVTRWLQAEGQNFGDYEVQYSYVVDADQALVGVLRLRSLLLAPPHTPIPEVMIPDPHSVQVLEELDSLWDYFERHRFLGAPVVDLEGRLLGVVKRHDVEAAMTDRADNDFRNSQGIVGGEELRSLPVLRRSRRRLAWLSINIVLNIAAASVIAMYQDTLSAVIALAVFLPIISDMSGCSGNQAVAVSIRELSLGVIGPDEALRVWGKELAVGVLNGLVLGLILGTAAWLWQGNAVLGLVVGGAMALNTLISVSIGGVVPILLKRFGVDPALASGPLLTTVTDVCGFLLVLGLATVTLSRLV